MTKGRAARVRDPAPGLTGAGESGQLSEEKAASKAASGGVMALRERM